MSSQNSIIMEIMKSSRTVFTMQTISMIKGSGNMATLAARMNNYVKQGLLLNPRKGIYAKEGYRDEEMACSIFRPSYLSLEYVLQRSGVVFQYDEALTSISYLSRTVTVGDRTYTYRKISPQLWAGMDGITTTDNVSIATPERAFLDMIYLSAGNCYFDNFRPLNKKAILRLLPYYGSKKLTERVTQIISRERI